MSPYGRRRGAWAFAQNDVDAVDVVRKRRARVAAHREITEQIAESTRPEVAPGPHAHSPPVRRAPPSSHSGRTCLAGEPKG